MSPRDHRTARDDARARRRSRAGGPPTDAASGGGPPRGWMALDEPLVATLQSVRDYPCASVLMSTTPGAAPSRSDADRLDRLVAAVGRRLRAEVAHHPIEPVLARLQRLVSEARQGPTARAVALFASFHHDALVALPVDVVDRVVVDPTFATRDLVRALAASPRVRMVVVSDRTVRLLEGSAGRLIEVPVPLPAPATARGHTRGRRNRVAGGDRRRSGSARRRFSASAR